MFRFVTYGMKHAKMWEYSGRAGQLFRPQSCAWAGAAPQDVLCAAFLPPEVDGSVDALGLPVEVRAPACRIYTYRISCRYTCHTSTGPPRFAHEAAL